MIEQKINNSSITIDSSNDIFNNLFEKTYTNNINLIYHIDYLTYKKELIKNISSDIDLIINFFDDEINDILINILILKKKNKIDLDKYKLFEPIYELVNFIDKLDFFDQEDFLFILLDLFVINNLADKIDIFYTNFKFKELVNIRNLILKMNNLFYQICKKNIFLKTLNIIVSSCSENVIISEIKFLAKQISLDFFMYYNSNNIYNKIINILLQISSNNNYDFLFFFKKYKNLFINEYELNYKNHIDIYSSHEFELKIKFKQKKKQNISKLVQNLNFIINIDN